MSKHGHFIAIEGTDGSGKTTHAQLLSKFLQNQGIETQSLHFPRYGEPSAYFVEQYLAGKFGALANIGPQKGSLFYAMDRYAASFHIRELLKHGAIVVTDRFTGSNLGHQGGKIDDPADRKRYYYWARQIEFDTLGIPRPDLNIVLMMPAKLSHKFVGQKVPLAYLAGQQRDIHENDISHLQQSERAFAELCELFPDQFMRIDCAKNGEVLPIDTIQAEIRQLVSQLIETKG